MSLTLFLFVLLAALIHASWNAIIKTAKADPIVTMCLMALVGGIISAFILPFIGLPSQTSFGYLLASSLVHILYYLMVGYCYKYAQYSAIYPIFRGTAPLITATLGALLLGEILPLKVWLGICILVFGLLLLSQNALNKGGFRGKTFAIALLLAGVVATYTVLDGQGARLSRNPPAYVFLTHLLSGIFILPLIKWQFKIKLSTLAPSLWMKASLAALFGMMAYCIVLYAMTYEPVGIVAAIRETSVLFAALIGWLFMGEKLGRWHFISSALIVIGLTLIK